MTVWATLGIVPSHSLLWLALSPNCTGLQTTKGPLTFAEVAGKSIVSSAPTPGLSRCYSHCRSIVGGIPCLPAIIAPSGYESTTSGKEQQILRQMVSRLGFVN